MSLFDPMDYESFAGALAGVTFVDQWDARVAKVGGKVFALRAVRERADGTSIVFKVAQESFEILTSIEGIGQAPYFAKRQWVSVSDIADLPDTDLRTYVERSYRLVAKGLTKKARAELGIEIG